MSSSEPAQVHLGRRYAQLTQMSYITRDMDAAVAHCERELGIGGFARSGSAIEVGKAARGGTRQR